MQHSIEMLCEEYLWGITPISMRLGTKIRAARIKQRLDLSQLAAPEFSVWYISNIENGRIHPSLRALSILANRLNVSLSSLFFEPLSWDVYEKQIVLDASIDSILCQAELFFKLHAYNDVEALLSSVQLEYATYKQVYRLYSLRKQMYLNLEQSKKEAEAKSAAFFTLESIILNDFLTFGEHSSIVHFSCHGDIFIDPKNTIYLINGLQLTLAEYGSFVQPTLSRLNPSDVRIFVDEVESTFNDQLYSDPTSLNINIIVFDESHTFSSSRTVFLGDGLADQYSLACLAFEMFLSVIGFYCILNLLKSYPNFFLIFMKEHGRYPEKKSKFIYLIGAVLRLGDCYRTVSPVYERVL